MDEAETGILRILWDFENVGVPRGSSAMQMYGELLEKCVAEGIIPNKAQVVACHVYIKGGEQWSTQHQQLAKVDCNIIACCSGKEDADRRMTRDAQQLIRDKVAGSVLIISSDQDFNSIVKDLGQAGIPTYVAHRARPGSDHEKSLAMYARASFRIDDADDEYRPQPNRARTTNREHNVSLPLHSIFRDAPSREMERDRESSRKDRDDRPFRDQTNRSPERKKSRRKKEKKEGRERDTDRPPREERAAQPQPQQPPPPQFEELQNYLAEKSLAAGACLHTLEGNMVVNPQEVERARFEVRMLERLTSVLNVAEMRSVLADIDATDLHLSTQLSRHISSANYRRQLSQQENLSRTVVPFRGSNSCRNSRPVRRIFCIPREQGGSPTPNGRVPSTGCENTNNIIELHRNIVCAVRDREGEECVRGLMEQVCVLLRKFDKRKQADLVMILKSCELLATQECSVGRVTRILNEILDEYPQPCVEHNYIQATITFLNSRLDKHTICNFCKGKGHRVKTCPSRDPKKDAKDCGTLQKRQEQQKRQLKQQQLVS